MPTEGPPVSQNLLDIIDGHEKQYFDLVKEFRYDLNKQIGLFWNVHRTREVATNQLVFIALVRALILEAQAQAQGNIEGDPDSFLKDIMDFNIE